jgi:hypothetical protein
LQFTSIRGPGLQYIVAASGMKTLLLTGTLLDDDAMKYCKKLEKLGRIDMGETKVTEAGLMQLQDLHWLTTPGPPDAVPKSALIKFNEAHVKSKQAARAAGIAVPPDGDSPFSYIRFMQK